MTVGILASGLALAACAAPVKPAAPAATAADSDGGRIVGGKPAVRGTAPWQMELTLRGYHFCGAAMIAPDWVVSATHCQLNDDSSALLSDEQFKATVEVWGGSILHDGPMRHYKIDQVHRAPGWQRLSAYNQADLMLLHIVPADKAPPANKLDLDVIALPVSSDAAFPPVGKDAMVTGWGSTTVRTTALASGAAQAPMSNELQYALINIIDSAECAKVNNMTEPMPPFIICAWHEAKPGDPASAGDQNRTTCQGDSGGPLVVRSNNIWRLVGIVSKARFCGPYPAKYTRVTAYVDWMKCTMAGKSQC